MAVDARTYRVVLPASADREVWLAKRREGIGSSDIPAIMGVAPRVAQHVYYDKIGDLPEDDDAGEAALWGTLDEETTAREWARRNRSVVRRIGIIARVDQPHMMCTLDRRITECPIERNHHEQCALEVKHTSAWLAGRWRRDVPDLVLAQVLWQIAVTGYDHIHIACRIGGNDYRQRVVRRKGNEQLIEDIVTVAGRFWREHVLTRTPPPYTGQEEPDSLLDLYGRLHPDREGLVDLDDDPGVAVTVIEDLRAYEEERLREAAHKKAKDTAKARLVDRLGGAEAGFFGEREAFTYRQYAGKRAVDLDRLAERWPDAYADCVSETTQRRIAIGRDFRIKKEDFPDVPA